MPEYDEKWKTIEGFIEALQIIARYNKDGLKKKFLLNAEHDILYTDTDIETPTEDSEDGKRLDALGWHYDKSVDSWAYFT